MDDLDRVMTNSCMYYKDFYWLDDLTGFEDDL